ncbi:MAG: DUF1015 family protein [Lachnospiraceae bacterium]|nr:DUF1015 family protein [Lachnospiraceae bacterium]
MADIRPFKAIRPNPQLASSIAALPYDVYSRQEAKDEIAKEPLSFLRIDRPETNFSDDVDIYDPRCYSKANEILQSMMMDGSFIQDVAAHYYIYELTMNGHSQTGIVACASVDDYHDHVIKKHENTREDKEQDRIRHVEACSAQTGPIFLGYRANAVIKSVTDRIKSENEPAYDFTSPDGIGHRVWGINDVNASETVQNEFKKMNSIYICDGHHRCASAVKAADRKRAAVGNYTGEEEFNYFLSVLFPDDELLIMDYNRVVRDLNGLSEGRFMDRIRKKFEIEEIGEECYRPTEKGNFGMYISDKWYHLKAKPETFIDDPVERLDVSVLQNDLLAPILNIEDPRTDPRIQFVGGIRGLEELERLVDSREFTVAFSMYPTDIRELFEVADSGELMPPKSTWFEPKLRSGLFIHAF